MEAMKNIMLKNGIDLEQMRKEFFASGDDCNGSIKSSKLFIINMCKATYQSIWNVVSEQQTQIDNDKNFTEYQKRMSKTSLLLAWEELERDEQELCLELHTNSKK